MPSPADFAPLLEALPEATLVADADGRIVGGNGLAAQMLGFDSPGALCAAGAGLLAARLAWRGVPEGAAAHHYRLELDGRVFLLRAAACRTGFGMFCVGTLSPEAGGELLERTRELEALRKLAEAALRYPERMELLHTLLSACVDAVHASGGAIYTYDQARKLLPLTVHQGMSPVFVEAVKTLRLGQAFTGKVAVTRAPVLISDLANDPALEFPILRTEQIRNFASFPLVAQHRLLGVMNLFTLGSLTFTGREVDFLRTLAAQVSLSLEHVTRLEELHDRNAELEKFNRLAVDRELRMIELKKRIRDLEIQLGAGRAEPPPR
jgi:hypothetical protein